jgi:hypothetical protein
MKFVFTTAFILIVMFTNAQGATELRGLTFGIGAGYNVLLKQPKSYALSTDTNTLQVQTLSRGGFVISSVLTVKLSRLAAGNKSDEIYKVAFDETSQSDEATSIKWYEKLTVNAALNLIEVNSQDISFNKNIDGGLGIGFVLKENVHLALFYDVIRVRQLREYVVQKYENKRIPNGDDFFNALDEKNDNLFYNKTFSGASLKIVFSLGNKKDDSQPLTVR